jgi:UPF0755 protein
VAVVRGGFRPNPNHEADMSRPRTLFLSLSVIFLLLVFLLLSIGLFWVSPAKKGAESQVVVVAEGEPPAQVAEDLHRRGVISSRRLFMLWVKALGLGKKIKAGEYSLGPGDSPAAILGKLTKGLILLHPVTIPEGFTRTQIAHLLSEKGLVEREKFLSLTQDPDVLKRYGIPGINLEGYLFPDTYHFGKGISVQTIVDAMVKRFVQLTAPLEKRAEESGMEMKVVVILASIVEKETGLGEERPLIASVFLNRLKKGMRLESDPTVIYGIEEFDGNLRKKDLTQETPYNTYVIQGLTPGPISNPGLDSMKAVLFPAKTDYLYFVSKNDGSHQFSKTLAEHNRAVSMYQKRRGALRSKKPS